MFDLCIQRNGRTHPQEEADSFTRIALHRLTVCKSALCCPFSVYTRCSRSWRHKCGACKCLKQQALTLTQGVHSVMAPYSYDLVCVGGGVVAGYWADAYFELLRLDPLLKNKSLTLAIISSYPEGIFPYERDACSKVSMYCVQHNVPTSGLKAGRSMTCSSRAQTVTLRMKSQSRLQFESWILTFCTHILRVFSTQKLQCCETRSTLRQPKMVLRRSHSLQLKVHDHLSCIIPSGTSSTT